MILQAKFHEIFEPYGLVYGVQVFPGQIRKCETAGKETTTAGGGYYAFVTFYSVTAATRAKEDLNSVLLLDDNECKVFKGTCTHSGEITVLVLFLPHLLIGISS